MKKIFKLNIDTERTGEPKYDALIVPSENSNKFRYFFSNPNLYGVEELPSIVYFSANFENVPKYDIPFNDSGLFIISKKLEKILAEMKKKSWFVSVPVVMIDDSFTGDKFNSDGGLNDEVPINEDYVAIRLGNLLDCFDYENSDFRPMRSDPKIPGRIKKIVLKEPENGFPPMFRINVMSSNLFVTEEMKIAIEHNDIKGCLFEKIETTYLS